MWNARLEQSQDGIKIAVKNVNIRYADDTTLMAESEEKLKSLLLKVKEESKKAGLKLSIKKTKIIASGPITSCQIDGKQWKKWQTFCGLQNTADGDCSHEIKKMLTSWKKSYDKPRQRIKKAETSVCWQRSIQSKLWFF